MAIRYPRTVMDIRDLDTPEGRAFWRGIATTLNDDRFMLKDIHSKEGLNQILGGIMHTHTYVNTVAGMYEALYTPDPELALDSECIAALQAFEVLDINEVTRNPAAFERLAAFLSTTAAKEWVWRKLIKNLERSPFLLTPVSSKNVWPYLPELFTRLIDGSFTLPAEQTRLLVISVLNPHKVELADSIAKALLSTPTEAPVGATA